MNYILEDDFDFYGELKMTKAEDSSTVCMVSHEPLTYNSITLGCKHSFNYIPLYNELCLHNNKEYINCPYCRTKFNLFIPFIPLPGVTKIYGVNYPTKMCMPVPKCSFIIKTGIHKAQACQHNGVEYAHGIFCNKHLKDSIEPVWTAEKAELFKTKSVAELKEMLKLKGLKVGGVKKELVNRLFAV